MGRLPWTHGLKLKSASPKLRDHTHVKFEPPKLPKSDRVWPSLYFYSPRAQHKKTSKHEKQNTKKTHPPPITDGGGPTATILSVRRHGPAPRIPTMDGSHSCARRGSERSDTMLSGRAHVPDIHTARPAPAKSRRIGERQHNEQM